MFLVLVGALAETMRNFGIRTIDEVA